MPRTASDWLKDSSERVGAALLLDGNGCPGGALAELALARNCLDVAERKLTEQITRHEAESRVVS